MEIGHALQGINECRFGASAKIDLAPDSKEKALHHVKRTAASSLVRGLESSNKIIFEEIKINNFSSEYRTEIFVLTRKELERLIINVEINTRREQAMQNSPSNNPRG